MKGHIFIYKIHWCNWSQNCQVLKNSCWTQMTSHPAKCYILRVTRKKNPILTNYEMLGQQLETVHQYPYLGVELSEDLGWDPRINKVISKANRTLWFLRRNIYKCPQDIKAQTYISLVRSHLEYALSVWDPLRKCHINALEMVQRKAARFVTSNYTREPGTVTTILQNLGWQTLENRRQMARLTLLYKSLNQEAAVNIPPYLTKPTTRTRQYHYQRFSRLSISTDTYKYSFIPRTISDGTTYPLKSSYHHQWTASERACRNRCKLQHQFLPSFLSHL